jgi:hypothetical protein
LFQPLSTKESQEYLYGTALHQNESSLVAQWNTLIGSDKGLIYALTKREADDIGKYLNIPVYQIGNPLNPGPESARWRRGLCDLVILLIERPLE